MRTSRTLAFVLTLVVVSVGAAHAQTVKIGTATDLTGIGALIAKAGVAGMEVGVEELNKKGGLLGRKVELIVRDSKLRPEIGARELKELILNEKIDLALGPVSSGVGLAMSEVAKELKVPICMHTSNTERMTVERGHRYIFQLVPNTFMEGTMVATRAAEKKEWKRYVLIGPDYDYGRTVAAAFTAKMSQLRPDAEIVKEFWPKLGEPDFTSYITGILAQKPDVLYSILWGGDIVGFLKQAKPYGLFDKMPLTEDYQRQIRQQTRLVNQLTITLKAYYPRALEVAELTTASAREFLQAYPTPEALTTLRERQWQRWARAHRLSEARTRELWDVLQLPQLPVPAHVVRAKARLMRTLVAELAAVVAAVAQYREVIEDFFASMPAAQWARTLPIGEHGIAAPTLWARLGDAPERWESFRHLQAQAGTVPVTIRSGKQQRGVHFRFACDKALRYIVDQVAFLSLRSSEWARAYYDQQRARGHHHRQALRALGAKWLKIIFVMWQRQAPYDEQYHLATMTRQQLRQRQKKIA